MLNTLICISCVGEYLRSRSFLSEVEASVIQATSNLSVYSNKVECTCYRMRGDSQPSLSVYEDPPEGCPRKLEHGVSNSLAMGRGSSLGKKVGTKIYVHRMYEQYVVPKEILERAKGSVDVCVRLWEYECIRYDTKTKAVSFQECRDFNLVDEPEVGYTMTVTYGGEVKETKPAKDPYIWHHKWRWVLPDYPFFDYEKSKARSALWEPYVTKDERRKIGRKSYWDAIRTRWE